jgi:hypothetical protein
MGCKDRVQSQGRPDNSSNFGSMALPPMEIARALQKEKRRNLNVAAFSWKAGLKT